jgi:hypothetical protein
MTVTANFAIDTFTVTVLADGSGEVIGSGVYDYGTSVDLWAVANDHYHFAGWNDGELSQIGNVDGRPAALRIIKVTQNVTLTARFAIDTYKVTVTAGVGGTTSGSGVYPYGSIITLTATPNSLYKFVSWSDGNKTISRDITVTGGVNITANFAPAITAHLAQVNVDATSYSATLNPDGSVAMWAGNVSSGDRCAGCWLTLTFDQPILLPSTGPIASVNFSKNQESHSDCTTLFYINSAGSVYTTEKIDVYDKYLVNYYNPRPSGMIGECYVSEITIKFGADLKADSNNDAYWDMAIPSGGIVLNGVPITVLTVN